MKGEKKMFQGPPPTSEIAKILRGEHAEAISQKELATLIPETVRSVASNPDQIEIRQMSEEQGVFSFLIIERNAPNILTDPNEYSRWKADIQMPQHPNSVNRLHAKFDSYIDHGELLLSDRVLMTCKFKLYPNNPQALYIADFDGEEHKGIGQDFYKNTLPDFCKRNDLRFIVGQNRVHNISFFKKTLGRYSNEDLKPEYRRMLFPGAFLDGHFTIQFLYPDDVEKYVEKK